MNAALNFYQTAETVMQAVKAVLWLLYWYRIPSEMFCTQNTLD
jgi:hypothetical protein